MQFLVDNWPIITLILMFVASLANTITVHYGSESGVKKALLVVSEGLSFFTSADVHDRVMKLPLTSAKPKE